jgi:hypothetical protein
MTKIIIVGAGWYGLHCYLILTKFFENCNLDIEILEKNNDIFNSSSNYNQNRLHLGYHYPRSNTTRNLCKDGYLKFIREYRDVVDFIDNNYYLIPKESTIDYDTFLKIYSDDISYDHTIISPYPFKNIDGNIINTKEKVINSKKAKSYFKENVPSDKIILNYEVKSIEREYNKISINNNDKQCDILIDCTYNQLQLSNQLYTYEQTISLLYQRRDHSHRFDSLTFMDGAFFSLFPRDISKQTYTLTHVTHTPLIKSSNLTDILKFKASPELIEKTKKNMEKDVVNYYPSFPDHFEYYDYFTSYKCKLKKNTDTRECIIEENDNIINVNCGKITGIFQMEKFIINHVKKFLDNVE